MENDFVSTNDIGCCDLNLHANTCMAGANFAIIEHTDQLVRVIGYTSELGKIKGCLSFLQVGPGHLLLVKPTSYLCTRQSPLGLS
jgi:hypothetical protein